MKNKQDVASAINEQNLILRQILQTLKSIDVCLSKLNNNLIQLR